MSNREEWRAVVGYEGLYEVSDQGRVRSIPRVQLTTTGQRRYAGRLLKPWKQKKHLMVTLSTKGADRHKLLVHRVVLEAFVGPPPVGFQGLHKNDIGTDNRLDNLYWGTYSDNMNDRVTNGIHHNAIKTHCIRGHEFTPSNTRVTNRGSRGCIRCQEERRSPDG